MSEIAEWKEAVGYDVFLANARENVELMKARFNDVMLNETEEELLMSIKNEIKILVIGTDRCNDTAGNLPVLARMVSISPKVELRILDSDSNSRLHQEFSVNGKRKTPVVLFLSNELKELCRWIERPNAAYKIMNENDLSLEDRRKKLKRLYSDPEILRQSLGELLDLLYRADLLLGRR
ncbi:MAG: thioredoxin family protein [Candidatus Thorarchaeota archaeon]|nr:MAG: thioredoxin family protein [Candidatus Thorarchaeota archaeon]